MFTKEEREDMIISLGMRIKYIQTGSSVLSAQDIKDIGADEARRVYDAEIKPLSAEQMEGILRMQKTIEKLINM